MQALQIFRAAFRYVTLTATALTALALILRRDFTSAFLAFTERVFRPLAQMLEATKDIVEAWHALTVVPVFQFLVATFNWSPPLVVVEIGTLLLFAAGPSIGSMLLARSLAKQVRVRRANLTELENATTQSKQTIRELSDYRDQYQSAYNSRNWERAKKVGGAIGSVLAAGVSLLAGGGAVRFVEPAAKSAWDSFKSWDDVREKISALEAEIAAQAEKQRSIEQTIQRLSSMDGGLLGRLKGMNAAEAEPQISDYIKRRMRWPILTSRIALGMVFAVTLSYLVDWVWR